ncbi:Uncharacterised protein [Bordetella pertussis]|nr:Uncharacterised protein [Bordetella pertussis]CPM75778.1 Uncharacterised protein [Bordetella pertussis]
MGLSLSISTLPSRSSACCEPDTMRIWSAVTLAPAAFRSSATH